MSGTPSIDLAHKVELISATLQSDGNVLLLVKPQEPRTFMASARHLTGKLLKFTMKVWRKTRSSQQNRYYWGVIIAIFGEYCGYEPDEMHEALAMKFLRTGNDPILGVPRRRSTALLDTVEFNRYMEDCRQFAMRFMAEQGDEVYIPLPNEVDLDALDVSGQAA